MAQDRGYSIFLLSLFGIFALSYAAKMLPYNEEFCQIPSPVAAKFIECIDKEREMTTCKNKALAPKTMSWEKVHHRLCKKEQFDSISARKYEICMKPYLQKFKTEEGKANFDERVKDCYSSIVGKTRRRR